MSLQREKPGMPTVEELKARFKLPPGTEGYATGGQFENFREGWAFPIFSKCDNGHYFKRLSTKVEEVKSLCGQTMPVENMYGIGSYPKCQHCLRMLRKLRSAS
jgi:hypothetical protein